jgi:hypothetical protein
MEPTIPVKYSEQFEKTYRLSPRRLYLQYIFSAIIVIILSVIYLSAPAKITILNLNGTSIPQFGGSSWKLAGELTLTKDTLTIIFLVIFALIFLYNLYKTIYSNSYHIHLSKAGIEFSWGILSTKVESLEMYTIIDFVFRQTLTDRMFGTGDVIIFANDVTTPKVIFDGFEKADAKEMDNFLTQYASDSLVKYYAKAAEDEKQTQNPNRPGVPEQVPSFTGLPSSYTPGEVASIQNSILYKRQQILNKQAFPNTSLGTGPKLNTTPHSPVAPGMWRKSKS